MITTNKHGVPDSIIRALHKQNAQYNAGKVHASVTQLIQPAQISLLRKKHFNEMVNDVSEGFYALLGSGVHHIVEQGATPNMIVEERLFMELDGWRWSGAIDVQEMVEHNVIDIIDYKVTSVYSVQSGGDDGKPDWVNQLNLHALLIHHNKPHLKVRNLYICAVLRDWSSGKAKGDLTYPQAPIVMVPINLWSVQRQMEYARFRIDKHRAARYADAMGEQIEDCSPIDRWVKGDKWIVKKIGGKRATKTFDSIGEAEDFAATKGEAYHVEYRAGKSTRCEYCGVSAWCQQYAAMQKGDDDGLDPVPDEDGSEG